MAKTTDKALDVLRPMGEAGGGVLRRFLELAIDGMGPLPSARQTAGSQLARHADPEEAIDAIVRNHVILAGAQGFATNIGGLAALPVTLPSNMAGVAIVQLRMVACIAHLRAYDVTDPRVRSAVMMCLLGNRYNDPSSLPASPLVVATAPVFNAELDRTISERVLGELISQVGGRRAATIIGRRIPLVGSGVGMAADGYATWRIAAHAREVLVDRRPRH